MTDTTTPEVPSPSEAPSMHIDLYERNWMVLSVGLLVVFFATVSVAGFALGFQVSGVDSEVDPTTVLDTEPWATPGLRQISDDHYEAYVVAKTWVFEAEGAGDPRRGHRRHLRHQPRSAARLQDHRHQHQHAGGAGAGLQADLHLRRGRGVPPTSATNTAVPATPRCSASVNVVPAPSAADETSSTDDARRGR